MKYSVAFTSEIGNELAEHLLRADGQEDLCFGLWYPSIGKNRKTALISEVILPQDGDRDVHGNTSFRDAYISRVLDVAMEKGAGVAFMHSHPYAGWQGMSDDDVVAERRRLAPAVKASTRLPLVGLTVGIDRAWSARFWEKTGPKKYEREWCESVRIIGADGFEVTHNDYLLPPPEFREELKRTISAWGPEAQAHLARLRFGIVGLGSVGSIIAETLARMGIQNIKLIDFDLVERHNLDRLLNAKAEDIGERKIDVIGEAIEKHATAARPEIEKIPFSVTEEDGFKAALDCDVIFSCVDRPWGRHVLNLIAYAHLIPVIDGGIAIHAKKKGMRGADWKMHTVGPSRRCLQCIGQYDSSYVNVERQGLLDDPAYIRNLPDDHTLKRNENVFPFSAHLASSQVLQMLSLVIRPLGISNVGEQTYHFVIGEMATATDTTCNENCVFKSSTARGDTSGLDVTGIHPSAEKIRRELAAKNRSSFFSKLFRR